MTIEPSSLTSLTQVSMFQLSDPIPVHYKETSKEVLAYWDQQMQAISAINDLVGTPTNPASSQITEPMRAAFETSLNNLILLAKNGQFQLTVPDPDNPPNTKVVTIKDVMTVQMAQDLDNLLRTVESVDIGVQFTGAGASINLGALKAWRDFAQATPVVGQIITHMNSARAVGGVWIGADAAYLDGKVNSQNQLVVGSLQSMVELIYVKTGNEIMAQNLEKLESALTTNKNALESLTSLQSEHTQLTAYAKGELPNGLGVTGVTVDDDAAATAYGNQGGVAQTFFDGITPELAPGMASLYDAFDAYQKVVDSVIAPATGNNLSQLMTEIAPLLATVRAEMLINGPVWGTTGNRSLFVQVFQDYRAMAITYNNAAKKLNAALEPFVQRLGSNLAPVLAIANLTIPITLFPTLPGFSGDQLPLVAGPGEGFSSLAQRETFIKDKLDPFIAAFNGNTFNGLIRYPVAQPGISAPNGSIFSFSSAALGNILNPSVDTVANKIYSRPEVVLGITAADVTSGSDTPTFSPISVLSFAKNMQDQYNILKEQIATLQLDPTQVSSPNSLLARLKNVVLDMENAKIENLFALKDLSAFSSELDNKRQIITDINTFAKAWILDGLDNKNTISAGKIQDNLGFAITAAESLNDQQKEETRRFLFLFEEFYKSASAILTKITELIQKMAQNINR